MWPLCSQQAGACLGCGKGAPCPSWGTASTSTVGLAVTEAGKACSPWEVPNAAPS